MRIPLTIAAIAAGLFATPALAQSPAAPSAPSTPGATGAQPPQFLPRAAAEERATELNRMLDTNHDGAATRAEVDAWVAGKRVDPAMVSAMFTDADADKDGRITLAEQKADALRSFDEADTDHDGRLTLAERDAAEARMATQAGTQPGAPLPPPTRRRR